MRLQKIQIYRPTPHRRYRLLEIDAVTNVVIRSLYNL